MTGLEPARYYYHRFLRPECLRVPSHQLIWLARRASNSHCNASKAFVSANWTTGQYLFGERTLESFQKALSHKRNKKQKRRSKVKLESGIRGKIQTFIIQFWRLVFYQLNYPYMLSSFTSCSGSCRNLFKRLLCTRMAL